MEQRILIVDDDPDYVEAVKTLLEAKGYGVLTAHDGKAGYELAKKEFPNLMLLDVMMPASHGFDIARDVHQDQQLQKIPVIIITGVRKEMGASFTFEPDEVWLPVKAVLEKPVKPEALLKAVEEHIRP